MEQNNPTTDAAGDISISYTLYVKSRTLNRFSNTLLQVWKEIAKLYVYHWLCVWKWVQALCVSLCQCLGACVCGCVVRVHNVV